MEPQELLQKLEARGITLSLCGQNLSTSPETIPNGIMTTIQAHKPALVQHLKTRSSATASERHDKPAGCRGAATIQPGEAADPSGPKKQFRNIPFKFTARQLLSGAKTQTRRRPDKHTTTWRAGEIFTALGEHDEVIAHIKALAIRKQRLGDITEDEAVAEGFKDLAAFRAEWIKYYRVFDAALEVMVLEFRVLPAAELKTGTAVPVLTELPELSEPAEPDKHVSQHASFTDLAVSFLEAVEALLVTVKDERPPVLRTPQLKRDLKATEAALRVYRAALLPDDPGSSAVGESLADQYRRLRDVN